MDINQLVRDSYKNTAAAVVSEMFREPEPDYSKRHVEALEKIAENTLNRVHAAEHELNLHKEQLDIAKRELALHEKEIEDAKREAKAAACRSWIAIGISILAITASIAGAVLQAAVTAGWIR